jgi:hypothetical protein
MKTWRCPVCKKPLTKEEFERSLDKGNVTNTNRRTYSYRKKGETPMAKVPPYHTNSVEYPPEHRNVYHDHDDCPDGKRILPRHRESGTGGKPRCKECIRLG